MDFTSTAQEMGKPSLNDLRSGLATAPVLYAAEEHPQLVPLIQRRFRQVRASHAVFINYGLVSSFAWPSTLRYLCAVGLVHGTVLNQVMEG